MSFTRKFVVHVLIALTLFIGVSSVAAAPASTMGNTQISGVGVFTSTTECPADSPNVYPPIKMTGGLVGCWYTDQVKVLHFTDNGAYQERGTETFVGCLSDGTTCGTFKTEYKFTAKYAPNGSEIHGHCEHPLVSGTGDFAGITGQVNFKDNVQTGEFFYAGHFKLP